MPSGIALFDVAEALSINVEIESCNLIWSFSRVTWPVEMVQRK